MPPSDMNGLVQIAQTDKPWETMSADQLLYSDISTITVPDLWPKAKFHFLCLPRLPFKLPESADTTARLADVVHKHVGAAELASLEALYRSGSALSVLVALERASQEVRELILCEMESRTGKVWPIYIGFHRSESMRHVHLHIISSDLISDKLKTKKHFNSFSPKSGFFFTIDDAIELAKSNKPFRRPSEAECKEIFDKPLKSFRTGQVFSNMPKLKSALEAEFKALLDKTPLESERPEPAPIAAQSSMRDDVAKDKTYDSDATVESD